MVTFGLRCWNSWITLIVRSWRSCEPHQAKRRATGSPLAAGLAAPAGGVVAAGCAAAGALVAAGAGELGALHAARTKGTTSTRWSQAGNDNRRIAASRGTESVFIRPCTEVRSGRRLRQRISGKHTCARRAKLQA